MIPKISQNVSPFHYDVNLAPKTLPGLNDPNNLLYQDTIHKMNQNPCMWACILLRKIQCATELLKSNKNVYAPEITSL